MDKKYAHELISPTNKEQYGSSLSIVTNTILRMLSIINLEDINTNSIFIQIYLMLVRKQVISRQNIMIT